VGCWLAPSPALTMGTEDTSLASRALPSRGVTHYDQICIIAYHFNGIVQGFPLGGTGGSRIAESDHPSSQSIDGGFETEPGAGGRLKKQGGNHIPFEDILPGLFLKFGGQFQDPQVILLGKICDRNEAFVFHNLAIYFDFNIVTILLFVSGCNLRFLKFPG
jgi:hypothetical protein